MAVRYSARINGLDGLVVTKLDVLDNLKKIKVCTGYRYNGKLIDDFPTESSILFKCEPVYQVIDGWLENTQGIKSFKKLPRKAQAYIQRIEELTGVGVIIVSVGAKREDAIILKNPFK